MKTMAEILKALEDVAYCGFASTRVEGVKDKGTKGMCFYVAKKDSSYVLMLGKEEVVTVSDSTYLVIVAQVFLTYIQA